MDDSDDKSTSVDLSSYSSEYDEWIESLPQSVRDVARRVPAAVGGHLVCYKSSADLVAHIVILSYGEDDDGDVTATVEHGADSAMPGLIVQGYPIEVLKVCACNKYRWASESQLANTQRLLRQMEQTGSDRRGQA